MIQIINNEEIPINVRVVHRGDTYSRDQLIYQSDEPLVEFYDARFTKDHCFRGQFINRYPLTALQDHLDEWPIETGIGLDDRSDHWHITGRNLMKAVDYALSTMKPNTDELQEELRVSMMETRKMRRSLVKALNRIDELKAELIKVTESSWYIFCGGCGTLVLEDEAIPINDGTTDGDEKVCEECAK